MNGTCRKMKTISSARKCATAVKLLILTLASKANKFSSQYCVEFKLRITIIIIVWIEWQKTIKVVQANTRGLVKSYKDIFFS